MDKKNQKNVVDRWKNDPVLFFEEVLGVDTLEPWQREAAYVVRDNDRISIKACHDVGKTWFMARIFLWFFLTRPNSKVLTTAPTWVQVEKLLWAEINSAVTKANFPLGGRCLNVEYKISDQWYAIGLSPRNETNTGGEGQGRTSSFQGFHAAAIMIIFDEATGVRPQVWDLAEGNLTSGETKFVAIGNPTARSSRFFDTFKDITWKNFSINCFVSPNFKANKIFDKKSFENEYNKLKKLTKEEVINRLNAYVVVNPYLLSLKWSMSRALKWGLEHPLFVSKVFGEFPSDDDNAMIPLSVVEIAQTRAVRGGNEGVRTVGLDCARFGSDQSIATEFLGWRETRVAAFSKFSIPEVVGETILWLKQGGIGLETHIAIDGGGLGGGVVDLLEERIKEEKLPWRVYEVQFGGGFDRESYPKGSRGDEAYEYDKDHYANQKAKMFDLLAHDMRERISLLEGILDGSDDVYQSELPDIQYSINSKSKIVLESKDDYKKRTGKGSPDHSDSVALANYARYIKGTTVSFSNVQVTKKKRFFDKSSNVDFTTKGIKKFKIKDF